MLIDKIKADNLTARKNKDRSTSGILTTLIGEIEMVGKNNGLKKLLIQKVLKLLLNSKKVQMKCIKLDLQQKL